MRIHTECTIGEIKNCFEILDCPLTITFMKSLSQVKSNFFSDLTIHNNKKYNFQ